MKKLTGIVLVFVFVFGLSSQVFSAEMDKAKLETFKNNIEESLKTDNDGVQFWALFLLSRLKSDMPSLDLTEFNRLLNRMADNDNSDIIRINAKMTYLYMNEPELVKEVRVLDRENPLIFYSQLYLANYNDKFDLEDVDTTNQIRDLVAEIEDLEKQM